MQKAHAAGPLPHFYAVILAGGRGTRFWPRSRRASAKQVLPVVGRRTLIQQTYARLRPLFDPKRFLVITNPHLRGAIAGQLPELRPAQIIAEPLQRNTAPAIGLAARLLMQADPQAIMGVFPADHIIARGGAFRRILRQAYRTAQHDHLVVFGIRPTRPDTGFGYIQFGPPGAVAQGGVSLVIRFREKPDGPAARRYVRSGSFDWNSGMFVWKAGVIAEALRRHLPSTAAALSRIRGRPGEELFTRVLAKAYRNAENISIDYAVLEKSRKIVGFRIGRESPDIGWNDVGSWRAVYESLPAGQEGNVARTEALFHSSSRNYIDAPGKLAALVGVNDLIVVDTSDALLIAHRERAQEVGEVVKSLEKRRRHDLL